MQEEYFGSLSDRQKEYTQGILESSQYLLGLINDILDLATIEAGHMVLETNVFDLHATLASVLKLTRERTLQHNLNLAFDCPVDIGQITADERRIKQVLFKLLINAIKFTPSGGTVTLGACRADHQVMLWIADNGEGVAAEDQAAVFETFRKSQRNGAHNPGAGLGLSLVKRFVELHGGTVDIESESGKGTRVSFRLPATETVVLPFAAAVEG